MLIKSKESVAVGECGCVHATAANAVSKGEQSSPFKPVLDVFAAGAVR